MRLTLGYRAPTEIDHELIWLSLSLGSLGLAAGWFALRLPWPHCMFLAVTGHPCLTCGATRSTIAFFPADFSSAWKWTPLVYLFLSALSMFDLYAFAVLVIAGPLLRAVGYTSASKQF